MIGTSTGPYVDSQAYLKVNGKDSYISPTNNRLPDPGYGLKGDGRGGARLIQLKPITSSPTTEDQLVGRRTSDNKFPYYTESSV